MGNETHYWKCFCDIFDNWAGFATGGTITAIVWLWLGWRQTTMTRKLLGYLSICFLLMAIYKAWNEQYEAAALANKISDQNMQEIRDSRKMLDWLLANRSETNNAGHKRISWLLPEIYQNHP